MAVGRVNITVLTYESAGHVVQCVDSVLAQSYGEIELKVVDNGSTDGSAEMVERRFGKIEVIRNERNLGFAAAHNRMIADTKADYYMPLNPDCRLERTFVERLIRAIRGTANAGYGTGKILLEEGHPPYRLYSAGHAQAEDGSVVNRGYGEADSGQHDNSRIVWGANGAAPLYSMKMLRALALGPGRFFEEMFFMYGEDVDLDWRAHWGGFRCVYEPSAAAFHAARGSGGHTQRRVRRQYVRNAQIVKMMNAPAGTLLGRMSETIIEDHVRYALGDPLGGFLNVAETVALAPIIAVRRRGRVRRGVATV